MTTDEGLALPQRLLKLPEVCHQVGVGKTMIYALIKQGQFPKPYRIGAGAARWSQHEIEAWISGVIRDAGRDDESRRAG